MRYLRGILLFAIVPAPALAQQTQCQWIGNTWNCNTQQRPGVDWNLLRPSPPPNYNNQVMDAYRQGQEARQRQQAMAAEQQRQADYMQCRADMKKAVDVRDFELAKFYASLCP